MSDETFVVLTKDSMLAVTGIENAKQLAEWGTYGKGGMEHCMGTCPEHQLRFKRLIECDTEHLVAILKTQRQIVDTAYPTIIRSILMDRGEAVREVLDVWNWRA